jgi:hypothetical protein
MSFPSFFHTFGYVLVSETKSGDVSRRLGKRLVRLWGEQVYEIRHNSQTCGANGQSYAVPPALIQKQPD